VTEGVGPSSERGAPVKAHRVGAAFDFEIFDTWATARTALAAAE